MRYNLALSGGGVRGYAHIGAVKALQELGIEIAAISGGSSGALIGALLCDGYSPSEIEKLVSTEEPRVGVSLRRFRHGLLSFSGIEVLMQKHMRSRMFEDLRIPLFVTATDLSTGKQHIFSKGNLLPALCASSALPLLLPPVVIDGVPYGDAGMSNNLPVEPLIGKPGRIIGIHVNPVLPFREHAGVIQTIDRSMHIIVGNTIRPSISMCDIFIEPPQLVNYHLLERRKAAEIVNVGYEHVKSTITAGMLLDGA